MHGGADGKIDYNKLVEQVTSVMAGSDWRHFHAWVPCLVCSKGHMQAIYSQCAQCASGVGGQCIPAGSFCPAPTHPHQGKRQHAPHAHVCVTCLHISPHPLLLLQFGCSKISDELVARWDCPATMPPQHPPLPLSAHAHTAPMPTQRPRPHSAHAHTAPTPTQHPPPYDAPAHTAMRTSLLVRTWKAHMPATWMWYTPAVT